MALCMPALLPSLSHSDSWEDGLWTGIKFNLPRVVLLTVSGAAIGSLFYFFKSAALFETVGKFSFQIGYVVIGLFLMGLGTYSLAHSLEEREDIKKGTCHPLFKLLRKKDFPIFTGGVFSLVCVGEAAVALETFILAGTLSIFYSNLGFALLLGSSVMFIFSIGLSIPTIAFTTLTSRLTEKSSRNILNKMRLVSSLLMIVFGMVVSLQAFL